ncbi:MAG: iron-sulfur cluster assembly scaffold protein [Deltaproteobacteria bacterium]|nr:iron-sulfur cluster assembly scaffold protein [Deltaproteobacteria bacterium]
MDNVKDKNLKNDSSGEQEVTPMEVAFYRWLHSLQWKNSEIPDGHACLTGKCGDTMEIFLKFNGECIKEAAYLTNGCISSKVCAALAAQMAQGKTPDEAVGITAQTILELLGDFPKGEEHCAFLAAETLQEALHNYMLKQSKRHSDKDTKA